MRDLVTGKKALINGFTTESHTKFSSEAPNVRSKVEATRRAGDIYHESRLDPWNGLHANRHM